MSKLSWAATIRLVHERAHQCCEYCQTCQDVIGQAMHVDHIDPFGSDDPENLCLSCATCNQSKSQVTSAVDPETGNEVGLYNPRTQQWSDHFMWIDGGLQVRGLTPIGRATVKRLKMNQDRLIIARSLWISAGLHPPR
jgi:HNH endonuclease